MGSPKNSLNNTDWPKIGKSFVVGMIAAGLIYTGQFASDTDFGPLTQIVAAVVPLVTTTIHRYIRDNTGE